MMTINLKHSQICWACFRISWSDLILGYILEQVRKVGEINEKVNPAARNMTNKVTEYVKKKVDAFIDFDRN